MAETLQVVSRDLRGRYSTVLDLNDGVTYTLKSGGVKLIPPPIAPLLVGSVDSEGRDSAGKSIGNGQVDVQLYVKAGSANAVATALATAIGTAYPQGITYYLKWQPMNVTLPVYYEIVSPSAHDVPYDWHEFANLRASLTLSYAVKPFGLGDVMSTWDGFDTNTLSEYTLVTGGADLSVTGGALALTANPTSAHRLIHAAKGYSWADGLVTVRRKTGATGTFGSTMCKAVLRSNAAGDTYLQAGMTGTGSLVIEKVVSNVVTTLATLAVTATVVATDYWIRFWADGSRLTAEIWTSQPTVGGSPRDTLNYTLSSAEAAVFVSGLAGVQWQESAITGFLDDLWMEPFSYVNCVAPDGRTLPSVPGDLDACVDVVLSHSAATATSTYRPAWAILAWWAQVSRYTAGYNLCGNGGFEVDVAGWDAANLSGLLGSSGGTITQDATHASSGTKALKFVAPASANPGPECPIFRTFRKGVTYKLTAQVFGAAASGTVTAAFGTASNTALGTPVTLSAAFQTVTVQWTPSADVDYAWIAFKLSNASVTIWVDDVQVQEGTGSFLGVQEPIIPVGEVPAGLFATQYDTVGGANTLVGWSLQSDATVSASRFQEYLGYSGAPPASLTGSLLVNPAALPAGYYGVFARVKLGSSMLNPTLTLSLADEYGNGSPAYTAEYGSQGKLVQVPTTTNIWRWQYLGALYFGNPEQTRARLNLQASYAAGSTGNFGVDSLHIVPMASLSTRRWDVGDQATDGFQPWHSSYVGETLLRSNGRMSSLPAVLPYPRNLGFSNGVAVGASVRLPAGSPDVFWNLTRVLPGDLATSTSTDEDTGAIYTTTVRFIVTPRYRFSRGV